MSGGNRRSAPATTTLSSMANGPGARRAAAARTVTAPRGRAAGRPFAVGRRRRPARGPARRPRSPPGRRRCGLARRGPARWPGARRRGGIRRPGPRPRRTRGRAEAGGGTRRGTVAAMVSVRPTGPGADLPNGPHCAEVTTRTGLPRAGARVQARPLRPGRQLAAGASVGDASGTGSHGAGRARSRRAGEGRRFTGRGHCPRPGLAGVARAGIRRGVRSGVGSGRAAARPGPGGSAGSAHTTVPTPTARCWASRAADRPGRVRIVVRAVRLAVPLEPTGEPVWKPVARLAVHAARPERVR
jgi:hypothetical protein